MILIEDKPILNEDEPILNEDDTILNEDDMILVEDELILIEDVEDDGQTVAKIATTYNVVLEQPIAFHHHLLMR
jgi:hypothetical protein